MDKKNFGDFVLLKELGKGTFGSVYLAEHRFIKKKFAIKIFPKSLSQNKEFIENFEKEVAHFISLDHPAVLKIHNISYAEKHYFLVMDAILDDEENPAVLEKYMDKYESLSEEKVEIILRQIASAIDYLHDKIIDGSPLLHGSIKPSNIFVLEKDDKLKVIVSDFGFSKFLKENSIVVKSFEKYLKNPLNENTFRDFEFFSPEQKRGEIGYVQSDVFSFGVLAYFLITKNIPKGYFPLPSEIENEFKLNWDLFICKCLSPLDKRPSRLLEALNTFLSEDQSDKSSLNVLSWHEVEKKVENAMQMSFEFSEEEEGEPRPLIKPQKIDRPNYEEDPAAVFQKELTVSYYKPKSEKIKEVKPILTKMVVIEGGVYKRGSKAGARDERPEHSITISSFAIDIHPITNEQFVLFLESMGGEKDSNNNDIIRLRDSRIKRRAGNLIIESGYLKHPVVGVTWYGAVAYAKWVGKRLPTEAEWEVAACGKLKNAIYPSGEKIDHTLANFFSSDTIAVMSYPPNESGLYDMAGNVYEWCGDWYAYNYYDVSSQEPENPTGPVQGVYRVLRGGCWKSLKEDLRCSHRHRNNPGSFNSTYGFRCAADVS